MYKDLGYNWNVGYCHFLKNVLRFLCYCNGDDVETCCRVEWVVMTSWKSISSPKSYCGYTHTEHAPASKVVSAFGNRQPRFNYPVPVAINCELQGRGRRRSLEAIDFVQWGSPVVTGPTVWHDDRVSTSWSCGYCSGRAVPVMNWGVVETHQVFLNLGSSNLICASNRL